LKKDDDFTASFYGPIFDSESSHVEEKVSEKKVGKKI
jgi:hypothetical protein